MSLVPDPLRRGHLHAGNPITTYGQNATMDRFTLNTQLEHLQSKHVGTGHADTTRYEWLVNQHRDTLALMVGSRHLAAQMALAEGESIARAKYMLKQRMIAPCHHLDRPMPPQDSANGNGTAGK